MITFNAVEFEKLFIQITEIFHQSIKQYKEKLLGTSRFSDVTLSHLFYLEAIYHLENPTLTELADHLNVSKASATAGVQKLIKKGLARKVQSSADQRVYHVSLSRDGMKLIEAEIHAFADFAENIKSSLTESEIRQLTNIFQQIIKHSRM